MTRASNHPDLGIPKPRPRLLEKRERKARINAEDRAERKKCHIRSGGRCEVVIVTHQPEASAIFEKRCNRRAQHNHHLLGGIGRRNVGASILAEHRIDTSTECHQEIEAALLEPYSFDTAFHAATVKYIRSEEC